MKSSFIDNANYDKRKKSYNQESSETSKDNMIKNNMNKRDINNDKGDS